MLQGVEELEGLQNIWGRVNQRITIQNPFSSSEAQGFGVHGLGFGVQDTLIVLDLWVRRRLLNATPSSSTFRALHSELFE